MDEQKSEMTEEEAAALAARLLPYIRRALMAEMEEGRYLRT